MPRDVSAASRPDLTADPGLMEPHDGRVAVAVILTIAASVVAFLLWAAHAPVYEVISGQGSIRPDGLARRVQHPDGGLVAAIGVDEGDTVEKGDLLLRLDDRDPHAEARTLTARIDRLDGSIAAQNALLHGARDEDRDGAVPAPRPSDDPALAEVALRRAQLERIGNEADEAAARLDVLKGEIASLDREAEILRTQRRRYDRAGTSGVVPLREIERLDREIVALEGRLAARRGEAELQEVVRRGADTRAAELVAAYRRDAALALAKDGAARTAAAQSLARVEARLARTQVTAPASGVIKGLAVRSAGEVIAPGATIMEIVPQEARSFAEIEIGAERIGGVAVGQEASVKVLTYDFTRYGDIPATVERISPESFLTDDGRRVFRVRLGLDADTLRPLDDSGGAVQRVSPGMTVTADIRAEQRSVLSYLLKPVRVIASRALTEG